MVVHGGSGGGGHVGWGVGGGGGEERMGLTIKLGLPD